jgi:hypothetical protein
LRCTKIKGQFGFLHAILAWAAIEQMGHSLLGGSGATTRSSSQIHSRSKKIDRLGGKRSKSGEETPKEGI